MRVAVADDSEFFRSGLVKQLVDAGADVVVETDNGTNIVELTAQENPDAVIIDIRMAPGSEGGLIAAEQLRNSYPQLGILALSAYAETDYAIRLLDPDPRATGYLVKHNVMKMGTLYHALECVAAGGSYVDRDVTELLMSVNGHHPAKKDFDKLSPKEEEILKMIVQGRANPYIKKTKFIAQSTLDTHMDNIYRKLQIPSDPDDDRRVILVLKYLHAIFQ